MGKNIFLKYGYLMYLVDLKVVPEIEINNRKYFRKNNYHVSLICIEGFSGNQRKAIFEFVQSFIKEKPIVLKKITNVFRLVTEGELQSIIVVVEMKGLRKLIIALNKKFGYKFIYPPTHITLFTLENQHGIGVDTLRRYRFLTKEINPQDTRKLQNSYQRGK